MPYTVKCFLRIDPEDPTKHLTHADALEELEQAKFLQPENRYKIETAPGGDDLNGPFIVVPFLGIEPEELTVHHSAADAEREIEHCRTMQPENIYEIIEV